MCKDLLKSGPTPSTLVLECLEAPAPLWFAFADTLLRVDQRSKGETNKLPTFCNHLQPHLFNRLAALHTPRNLTSALTIVPPTYPQTVPGPVQTETMSSPAAPAAETQSKSETLSPMALPALRTSQPETKTNLGWDYAGSVPDAS